MKVPPRPTLSMRQNQSQVAMTGTSFTPKTKLPNFWMRTNLKNYWLRYGNFIEPVELADQWLAYLHKHAKLKGSLLYQRGPRRSLQQYKKSLVDVPAQAARMWHLQFVSGFLRRNQQIPNLLVVNPWAKKTHGLRGLRLLQIRAVPHPLRSLLQVGDGHHKFVRGISVVLDPGENVLHGGRFHELWAYGPVKSRWISTKRS